jgi:hypothetical protein
VIFVFGKTGNSGEPPPTKSRTSVTSSAFPYSGEITPGKASAFPLDSRAKTGKTGSLQQNFI